MSDQVPDAYDKLEHEHEIFRRLNGVTEGDCFHTLNRSKRDVLLSLWRIDGGRGVDVQLDVSDMRDGNGLSQPGVYNALTSLKEDNLVSKRQGDDGRTKHYELTTHGEQVVLSGAARFIRD
jgi:DNA-binding MarR family transcriptional regulator